MTRAEGPRCEAEAAMRTRLFGRLGAHAFGTFGLLLVLVMSKLARYEVTPRQTYPQRACAWLARLTMDGIAAIGWLVDRLPPQAGRMKREPELAGKHADARTA